MNNTGHVTVEKTAKRYKLRLLLSVLGLIVGIFWLIGAISNADVTNQEPNLATPSAIIVLSLLLWIITKIQIWWNHG